MLSRLVVLGSCGAWPEAGRACSGYVLEHAGTRVVLDLGYGTLPRLLTLLDSPAADGIDAVVISHAHPDHVVDLHALLRVRWFSGRAAAPIPLYAPASVLALLTALEGGDMAAVTSVFTARPLPAKPYRVGALSLQAWSLPHHVPNVGVRLSAPGLTVAYTGDTGPDPALAELGRDADLFIVEATDLHQQPGVAPGPPGPALDLTAREAGAAAAAAGARGLLLTHFWPGNDRELSRVDAGQTYGGDVQLAEEGLVITLP